MSEAQKVLAPILSGAKAFTKKEEKLIELAPDIASMTDEQLSVLYARSKFYEKLLKDFIIKDTQSELYNFLLPEKPTEIKDKIAIYRKFEKNMPNTEKLEELLKVLDIKDTSEYYKETTSERFNFSGHGKSELDEKIIVYKKMLADTKMAGESIGKHLYSIMKKEFPLEMGQIFNKKEYPDTLDFSFIESDYPDYLPVLTDILKIANNVLLEHTCKIELIKDRLIDYVKANGTKNEKNALSADIQYDQKIYKMTYNTATVKKLNTQMIKEMLEASAGEKEGKRIYNEAGCKKIPSQRLNIYDKAEFLKNREAIEFGEEENEMSPAESLEGIL